MAEITEELLKKNGFYRTRCTSCSEWRCDVWPDIPSRMDSIWFGRDMTFIVIALGKKETVLLIDNLYTGHVLECVIKDVDDLRRAIKQYGLKKEIVL